MLHHSTPPTNSVVQHHTHTCAVSYRASVCLCVSCDTTQLTVDHLCMYASAAKPQFTDGDICSVAAHIYTQHTDNVLRVCASGATAQKSLATKSALYHLMHTCAVHCRASARVRVCCYCTEITGDNICAIAPHAQYAVKHLRVYASAATAQSSPTVSVLEQDTQTVAAHRQHGVQ